MSLKIEHLSKNFGTTESLKNVSLTFEPQTIYGLLGRNGAGKSTLMSILNNRIIPNDNPETNVTLDGEQLLENDKQLSRLFLMSEVNLYPNNMRVKTIFKWTERFFGDFDWDLAQRMTDHFNLNTKKRLQSLSTGYRTIAKIIIALCTPSDYVFLDEPVLGMDAANRKLFYSFIIEAYEKRPRTFVISTHIIDEIASLIETAIVVNDGEVISQIDMDDLQMKGKVISGPQEAATIYTANLDVIGADYLGGSADIYTIGDLPKPVPGNLTVSGMTLQNYFVQLTTRDTDELN